jgi:hypothetical protein
MTVATGAGLGVNLTLDRLNLDASLGDYLSINAGKKSQVHLYTINLIHIYSCACVAFNQARAETSGQVRSSRGKLASRADWSFPTGSRFLSS